MKGERTPPPSRSRGEERLRHLLTRQKFARIAKLIGVNRSTVWRWARGTVPHPTCIALLEATFGIEEKAWFELESHT